MTIIATILIGLLGASIGSFLSVLIYRVKNKKKGIFLSRSFCTSCKKKIQWQHLMPLFSWLFLRGKCAYCGKKISAHYFILELTTAFVFVMTFLKFNFVLSTPSIVNPDFFNYSIDYFTLETLVFYLVEFTIMMAIFFYDALYQEIPDRFSVTAIALAIVGAILLGNPDAINMLVGGLAIGSFFLLQFLISNGRWIGGGDIRLGILMGLLLGWELGLLAIILSYFLGSIYAFYLLATKKVTGKSAIAFGPFLVMGTILSIWYGDVILDFYLSTILF
jgi:leader peptidase (prepilin peptidase) / N-methyltransferase